MSQQLTKGEFIQRHIPVNEGRARGLLLENLEGLTPRQAGLGYRIIDRTQMHNHDFFFYEVRHFPTLTTIQVQLGDRGLALLCCP